MNLFRTVTGVAALLACAAPLAAGQGAGAPVVDRTLVIRGCVTPADPSHAGTDRSMLVWTKGDVMLTGVTTERTATQAASGQPGAAVGTSGTAGTNQPVLYWLDETDELSRNAGRMVEVTGQLGREFRKGEFEIERKGDITEIRFDAHGNSAVARVPAGFLGSGTRTDVEYDVLVRDVDVKNVRVLSATCAPR